MLTEDFKATAIRYVVDLVETHVEDIEILTIWETAADYPNMPATKDDYGLLTLTEEQFNFIIDLVRKVKVTVSFQ